MLTLLRIGWINLSRDRVAQAMTFLLPIIFFSIFAGVFGGRENAMTARIRVAVVDEDRSDLSARMVAALHQEGGLRVQETATGDPLDGSHPRIDRATGERLVRAGDVPVAIVIPRGLGDAFGQQGFGGGPAIVLLADPSDPIAPNMVTGLLQKVTMTAAPDLMMQGGIRQFETHAGALTPTQRQAVDRWLPQLRSSSPSATGGGGGPMGANVQVVDVMRASTKASLISFYAAGIGVMFLLFSMVGAAGSVLLDEAESGTLDRLLSTRVGMTGVLIGKWTFMVLVGCAQLLVMFTWGSVAFGLPLLSHLPGFAVMTAVTAAAAAAVALCLATLARSRAQLSGFSTILILSMSALGGSMFPRFLMSETMQQFGLLTFNAWALDGYLKVFWRDAPLWQLWPQVAVLVGIAIVFLGAARLLARRWEAV
jgi:ABC-2 type transport system permease protein